MKQVINQFKTNQEAIEQLSKDLLLFGKHVIVSSTSFYDRISELHTTVIFYYE